ncbi:phage tail family protein [Bacillus massiliigorillae]|uniref:phage tail family protein n=1 Tax=Bacillus massiliigorillae TaxID=1243664 RepID=UPI00039EE8CD|nr:phage tail family protein [Bacillus massiliigorillae]
MIYIETLEGTRYNTKSIGIIPLNFILDSPSPIHFTEQIEGRSGYLDLGTAFEGRKMRVKFFIQAVDFHDYSLLRNEVFKLFYSQMPFYLINTQEKGKRWLVKTAASYTPERLSLVAGTFEIEFVSSSPYAESVGTTMDPLTFDSDKWQFGQNLGFDIGTEAKYAHSTTTFRIYNASDIDIDPRELPLLIKYQGASNNLKITNTTTGDVWQYSGTSNTNDTIKLEGIRSLKNSLTIFGDTNRKLITLKKGWNDFTLSGTSGSFLISFDFRFYYI